MTVESADTSSLSDIEIFALTLIGESESLGVQGMNETACTVMNRALADKGWLGGNKPRDVCLQANQYDAWWPQENNDDRARILMVAKDNPLYGPYLQAQKIAALALNGTLPDCTQGAVSYYDSGKVAMPYWARGKVPCHVNGKRFYFNLAAIS